MSYSEVICKRRSEEEPLFLSEYPDWRSKTPPPPAGNATRSSKLSTQESERPFCHLREVEGKKRTDEPRFPPDPLHFHFSSLPPSSPYQLYLSSPLIASSGNLDGEEMNSPGH